MDAGSSGRRVGILTGGNAGLGLAVAKELVREHGLHLIITCRSEEKGREAVADILNAENVKGQAEFMLMDLNSLRSVKNFVEEFKKRGLPLHLLINNAGIMAVPFALTEDGYESQFQVNHLGHFLLTQLLLDVLQASAPSRIINLASRAHYRWEGPVDYVALKNETAETYDAWKSYGRAKLGNIMYTYSLHKRLNADKKPDEIKVTVNTLHPGLVDTGLLPKSGLDSKVIAQAIPISEGIKTPVYLATSPEVASVSGQYFFEQQPTKTSDISYNEEEWEKLWKYSLEWVAPFLSS